MRDLLAPLHDHKGRRTPSEASRAWFLLVIIASLAGGQAYAEGNIVIGVACGLTIATILLNIGWLILNTVGENRAPIALTSAIIRMSETDESE